MSLSDFSGFGWLLLTLGPLLFIQSALHREIQAIFLLLTRQASVTISLFSILFLPGVFLHELSHFLMAKILWVRTGRFSIFPRPAPGGKLQMGFVEIEHTDIFRDTLIGIAPLVSGLAFTGFVGINRFGLAFTGESSLPALQNAPGWFDQFWRITQVADFWLWFYLVFAVTSTMFPSAADRRAWLPIFSLLVGVLAGAVLLGAGPWMVATFSANLKQGLNLLTFLLAISLIVHVLLFIPAWGLRKVLSRITGYQIIS